jgi:predicted transcriptional regulator
MNLKNMTPNFNIIVIFFSLFSANFISGSTQDTLSFNKQNNLFTDSTLSKLVLPNPYQTTDIPFQLSSHQMIKNWVFQNRDRIFSEFSLSREKTSQDNFAELSRIDWSLSTPGHNLLELDFRESSLFIPANVRDFLEYKMGRTRYIPIVTLAGAAFLAYQIYHKYGYLIAKREHEKFFGINLNNHEIVCIEILWESPGLTAPELYSQLVKNKKQISYLETEAVLNALENDFLVKSRQMIEDEIKYFPAISKEEFVLKLKEESSRLDGLTDSQRLLEIKNLIERLE